MDFEYNELNLKIANNKKEFKEIERIYKIKKVKLVINDQQIKENEILSLVALNNCNILVIPI